MKASSQEIFGFDENVAPTSLVENAGSEQSRQAASHNRNVLHDVRIAIHCCRYFVACERHYKKISKEEEETVLAQAKHHRDLIEKHNRKRNS